MPPEDSKSDKIYNSCPSCGKVVDVTVVAPFTEISCPHCAQRIRARTQFGQFVIQSRIGEGGMSRVFAANDTRLGRSAALKILHREYSSDSIRMAQFEREAKLTAGVSHPNVVKVYSVGQDQGYYYIAMEHVTGMNLEQTIREQGRLDEDLVLDLGIQVAGGLKVAYLKGLIHRDVKPGNILITENKVAKLVDFGLAIFSEGEDDLSDEIWATPYYVPPEKLEGQPDDLRGDIYSLGATLFHALAGRPPFDADTNSLNELKRIKNRPVRLHDYAPEVGPQTAAVIDRMMAREPDDRYPDYDHVLEALNDARSLLGAVTRSPQRMIMHYWLKVAGIAAAVLALALVLPPLLKRTTNTNDSNGNHVVTDIGGTSVRTSDGSTVSDKFIESRNALFDGDPKKANRRFRELANLSGVRQPTLNWVRFNAALCAWIEGDAASARSFYNDILADADYSSAPADAELVTMFRLTGEHVVENKGYSPELAQQLNDRPNLVLGLLALAFERWASHDLEGALEWMEHFSTGSVGMTEHAIPRYRELADPYLHDLRLAAPWMDRARPGPYLEENLEARKKLAKVAADLRVDSGAVRKRLSNYLESLDQAIMDSRAAEAEAERKRLAEITRRELAVISALNETLEQCRDEMNFAAAVAALEAARFESPEARAAQRDRLYVWQLAEQFVVHLLDDLDNEPYAGSFLRLNNPPLQGRLAQAGQQQWLIRVNSGEIQIPFRELDPRWLISLAKSHAEKVSDSTEYYQRQECIVGFAHVMRQTDLAKELASALMKENRSFRERWQSVLEMTFGS